MAGLLSELAILNYLFNYLCGLLICCAGINLNSVKLIFTVERKEIFTSKGGFKRVQVSGRLESVSFFFGL